MATMFSITSAPGTPTNVTMDASVLTNISALPWDLDSTATALSGTGGVGGLAGYKIVEATDEPF